MTLEMWAPAKINLTLEVLGRRPDGYHEIASVIQAIDLFDRVLIEPAGSLELEVAGEEVAGVPMEGPRNLAYKAAMALAEETGRPNRGARIVLEKGIPAGLGLGGGSSDAAAALRGLDRLWGLDLGIEALAGIGARVGSDVAFFLHGGAAVARGRGEAVEPLPDHEDRDITLFLPEVEIPDKTRRMYALIDPADFGEGHATAVAAATIRRGLPLTEEDLINVFDRHIGEAAPPAGRAMDICRHAGVGVHAAGSGPAFYAYLPPRELPPLLQRELAEAGVRVRACRMLSRRDSLKIRET